MQQVVIGFLIFQIRTKTGIAFYTEEQRRWKATRDMMRVLPHDGGPDPPVKEVLA